MSTYRELSYSIQEQIKNTHDDSEVSIPQIVFWIRLVQNQIISQTVGGRKQTNHYLQYFNNVKVYEQAGTKRKYSVLPQAIVDIDKDGGIETVSFTQSTFTNSKESLSASFERVTPSKVQVLYEDTFRKPAPNNVKFFRTAITHSGEVEKVLMYLGLECLSIPAVDMFLHVSSEVDINCDLDKETGLSPGNEAVLYYEVLKLAKHSYMIISDMKNDGSDTSEFNSNFRASNTIPTAQTSAEQTQEMA
jgi:hypothetical protein